MAAKQNWRMVFSCIFLIIILVLSPSETTDLLSRCSPKIPRTVFLKATEWGKCYEFHMEEREWRHANNVCASRGGHLVTVKEERVQTFLLKTLSELRWPRNGLWLGATDKEKEMEWRWVTGELVSDGYSRWASGQPSCGILCFEDCALMRWKEGGKWHDYKCDWLEDYSFICEYGMLPEPTTTATSTTTAKNTTVFLLPKLTTINTTITKIAEEISTGTNSSTLLSSVRVLESEYLLHAHKENVKEDTSNLSAKNKSDADAVPPSVVMINGVNGARAEQVQERASSTSSSLGSGSLALVIVAVLVILAVGTCLVLIVMRRRHRKKLFYEDDRGISYGNPYYEASPTNKRSDSHSDVNDTDTDEHQGDGCGNTATATGFTDTKSCIKQTEMKEPQNNSSRPRCVMNNYDTPPTLITRLPVCMKKNVKICDHNVEKTTLVMGDNRTDHHPLPEETSNYYDEVRSNYRNSGKVTYDVPRASKQKWYQNNDDRGNSLSPNENEYYNSYEENIYESVGSLVDIIEQQRFQPDEQLYGQDVKDEDNRYVPFLFDAPKEP